MMRIRLTCHACGTAFKVEGRHAGKTGRCPKPECRAVIHVPAVQPPAPVVCAVASAPKLPPMTGLPPRRGTATASKRPARPAKSKGVMPYVTAAGLLLAVVGAVFLLDSVGTGGHPQAATTPSGGLLLTSAATAAEAPPAKPPEDPAFAQKLVPFLAQFCTDCHGPDFAEAGVNLAAYDSIDSLRDNRRKWNQIAGMIRIGAMPPSDHEPQPTQEQRREINNWLEQTLNRVDCQIVDNPGRVTIRRLNRVEYNNTVRDLVGVDFEPAAEFPSDDVGNGFDNQGDVLSVPPLLMEKYLDAAETITAKALVADPESLLVERKNGDALGSHGDVTRKFKFEAGEYLLRVGLSADQAGNELAKSEIRFDGKLLGQVEVQHENQENVFEYRVTIAKPGEKKLAVNFINDFYDPNNANPKQRDRNLYVKWLEVRGPKGGLPELPETHSRIVFTTPRDGKSVSQAAAEVLGRFANRAFRRPVNAGEMTPYVHLVEMATQQGETFEQGIAYAVQGVLVSPQFLFRIETDRNAGQAVRGQAGSGKSALGDYQLANRLSYFLWSSMPDDELFKLAAAGELSKPDVLRGQIPRMLADPKSQALIENFFGQWLNLRNLNEIEPDSRAFPQWNTQLREAMRKETELFSAEIVRENRSILDVLDADFTYINPRLAELYGVRWKDQDPVELYFAYDGPGKNDGDYRRGRTRRPGYYKHENEFVRVTLPPARRGVLTQASILTLTSNPGETSPVKRGKWILENLLGTPPPPAPPGVPAFDAAKKAKPDATLREQLALHRDNASCASCHNIMDPLGLGFENFDVIGRWRDKDGNLPIDASGTLEGGKNFNGAVELVGLLKGRNEQIARHFIEKLMTYGLGRGLEYYDHCAVDEIAAAAATENYRFVAVVAAIVTSDPFRLRQAEGETR